MNSIIKELAYKVLDLCNSSENSKRKELWEKHNNLEGDGRILFNVHLWRTIDHRVWYEIIPDNEIKCGDETERFIERCLRRKLFKYSLNDDDVILPTIWVQPVLMSGIPIYGVSPLAELPDDIRGSKKYRSVINSKEDIKMLKKPVYYINEAATQERVQLIEALTDSLLPVKVLAPQPGTAPFENVAEFRSMDDLLYDFYDDPVLVHEMMEFFTTCILEKYKELDALCVVDPESTWDFRVHYDRLLHPDRPNSIKNCWAYIQAQSSASISPKMYAEFIQPYHERIAALFGKLYYHGCEDLTEKADIIKNLPNLRRFHISPWSDMEKILDKLKKSFVYEVHVHPANHLFLLDDKQIIHEIKRIARIIRERGVTADLNISDIETISNDGGRLIRWSRLAREALNA